MKKELFTEIKDKIISKVRQSRLREAFALTRQLSEGKMAWEITDALNEAEDSYRRMLSYVVAGADDPARESMAAELGETVRSIVDRLERANSFTDTPTLYYNVARYAATVPQENIPSLLDAYRKQCADTSLINLMTAGTHSGKYLITTSEREAAERRIFNLIWVTFPLKGADRDALRDTLLQGVIPEYTVGLFTWAIIMGGMEFFDSRRLEILCELYAGGSDEIKAIAVIGLLILMYRWRDRRFTSRLKARFDAIRELPSWQSDLRTVYMELTRTRDTERITAKIRDEIAPEMMKLRPDIERKFRDPAELPISPEEMEDNPEWQEMLDKTGLSDRLKEMSEIQEEGGDVMMGTFSHLKQFPFFNEIANWFIPFHSERSEFAGDAHNQGVASVATLFEGIPFLCDSDKYSMLLSLTSVPEQARQAMMSQFNAQADHFNEIRAASLDMAADGRRDIIRRHVHNLYRFFRLFRRKGEFHNPFAEGVQLVDVPALASDVKDPEYLRLIAEFYFTHGYWQEALNVFRVIDGISEPSAWLYQKMGHAMLKLGNPAEALSYFEKADMLDNRSVWTLTRLARCYVLLGHHASALSAYERLDELRPDNAATALAIGREHLTLRHYPEAVKALYKAMYLDEKSGKAIRPLAWALFMDRHFDQARKYYERIITDFQPQPEDYLNMGHLALVSGNFTEACNFYRLSILSRPQPAGTSVNGDIPRANIEAFITEMRADAKDLARIGFDPGLVPLVIDAILYSLPG